MKYLPELLTDLWSLGCYPDLMVRLLKPLLAKRNNVQIIDLGCGKGAASITLARDLGFHVTGVDLSEPFLAEARSLALKYQVEDLCRFKQNDIRTFIKKKQSFDVVIYSSLGALLGDLAETVYHLRRLVHRDGLILIDEAFLKKDTFLKRSGYTHFKSHKRSVALLQKWGDVLISEMQINPQQTAQINRNYVRSLRKQSKKLIRRIPEQKKEIESYIHEQEKECHFIESHLTECIWILQKKDH
jgi:cyclopropane fatty-acyl-phospholipid synthase-like methyltransferase